MSVSEKRPNGQYIEIELKDGSTRVFNEQSIRKDGKFMRASLNHSDMKGFLRFIIREYENDPEGPESNNCIDTTTEYISEDQIKRIYVKGFFQL